MISRKLTATAVLIASLFGTAAFAGEVADFERDMRTAYGSYRSALFMTNANKPDEAGKAVSAFKQQWSALAAKPVPAQYADDAQYKTTLDAVTSIAEKAAEEVSAAKLPEAHETLEKIRDEISSLHERNGIIGFSDRMNAYHAKMEQILGKTYGGFDAAGFGELREDAAVLAHLAADIAAHPAAEAEDTAYKPLLQALETSSSDLVNAARSGDVEAAKKAVGALKVPYSKFFLKFG